jgi:hypothetical protein
VAGALGGMEARDARMLREVQAENTKLKKLLAEAHLDTQQLPCWLPTCCTRCFACFLTSATVEHKAGKTRIRQMQWANDDPFPVPADDRGFGVRRRPGDPRQGCKA